MRIVSADSVGAGMLRQLGIPPEAGTAMGPETVAALVRRAAGFACPCPRATLVDAVCRAAGHWLGEDPRDTVWTALEAVVTNGDLVETRVGPVGSSSKAMFLAAPGYVLRQSGAVFLQGIVPDQPTGLPPELAQGLRYREAARWLEPRADMWWDAMLPQLGFAPLSSERWFGAPSRVTAREHCSVAAKRLDAAPAGGDPEALEIIDPAAKPTYFTGRFKRAGKLAGRFVGRRDRPHGAPIWCYAEVGGGQILRLLDFHDEDDPDKGRDTGWHLQMALDACAGTPQRYRLRPEHADDPGSPMSLDLYSPIPSWAERRLLAVGRKPDAKGRGALMTIMIPPEEVGEEVEFLKRSLWLAPHE